MKHVVLFGDSIIDNESYTGGEPAVAECLRSLVPVDWKVTLRAVDGAVVRNVREQLARMPADSSHLVLSIGGNDALHNSGYLYERAGSVAEVLSRLAQMGREFRENYSLMLDQVLTYQLPVVLCTIYEGDMGQEQPITNTALTVYNDVIIREAIKRGLPLLDLRQVCTESSDFVSNYEPSATGGRKIAEAIYDVLSQCDFELLPRQFFGSVNNRATM